VSDCSTAECISIAVALQRVIGWAQAEQARVLVRIATHPDPTPAPEVETMSATAEVALALRWSHEYAADRMESAARLVQDFPDTLEAVTRGEVPFLHATVLVDKTAALDDASARKVEQRVLAKAGSQTISQFRSALRRAVNAVDTRTQDEQHQADLTDRRVCYQPAEHAMAWLNSFLPAVDAQAALTTVQGYADKLKDAAGSDDPRTADQFRADALVAIFAAARDARNLDGRNLHGLPEWQGRRPHIQVVVALSTLLSIDNQSGELAGYGPIPADLARRLAADPTGTWTRLVTDHHGQLLDYGRTSYRPPQDLIDHIIARDRTCRWPGCHRQARRCDLDHIQDWSLGGETKPDNMQPLCRRHHRLKHHAGWKVHRRTDGTTVWTSPTGRTYEKPPDPTPVDQTRPKNEPAEDPAPF
jgi:hypothetical protein